MGSIRSEPRTFNRYASRDAVSEVLAHLTQAKLMRVNKVTQEIEPALAARWSVADGVTFTLTLRDGIKWSDGVPFSSADVLFSFRAVYDEKTASVLGSAMRVGGRPLEVSAPDASTIVLKFPASFGPGLRLLDNLVILPRHRLEAALDRGALASAWSTGTPPTEIVGLGPFVLSEYSPGQRLTFVRNPHYWRSDGGEQLPKLDRLTLEIVPDQNAELLRLEAGQVDFTQGELRPDDYNTIKRAADAGRVRLLDLGIGPDGDAFWFNLNPGAKARDARRAWLQSEELRKAISHAIDRQAFANTVFLGAAVPIHGPITPANRRWYSPNAPVYQYDPARARDLLAKIGLADRNGDGLLEDRRSQPVRFSVITLKGNTALERGATVVREDLRTIGVTMDVVPLEAGALIQRLQGGDYDAIYFRANTTDTDPAMNLDYWLSSGSAHLWNMSQSKPATDWERQIDDLMLRQTGTLDDTERKRLFDEVQRIFGEHLPAIYFVAPRLYYATSARVAGATPSVFRPPLLWNVDALTVARPSPAN